MNAVQAKAHAQEVTGTQRLLSEEMQFQETLNKDIEKLGHFIKSLKKYKALNDKSHCPSSGFFGELRLYRNGCSGSVSV